MRFLYVLKLEDDCWYVGTSKNPMKRALDHSVGEGAAWTKLHAPITPIRDNVVITSLGNVSVKTAEYEEDLVTEKMQNEYGLNKVRGGYTVMCKQMKKRPVRSKARWIYYQIKNKWN